MFPPKSTVLVKTKSAHTVYGCGNEWNNEWKGKPGNLT